MIRNLAAAGLLALSACPYDELAANATPGDGGLWFGDPNDGGLFVPQDPDASGVIYLTKAPSQNTLCKLVIGNYAGIEMDQPPAFVGTWIGDVEKKGFFGPPASNAEQLGIDSATLSYHWPEGGVILSFKWVQVWERSTGDRACDPIFDKSFFLSDISMEGDPQFQDCWRAETGYAGQVPCPECRIQKQGDCGGSNDVGCLYECRPYPCTARKISEAAKDCKR